MQYVEIKELSFLKKTLFTPKKCHQLKIPAKAGKHTRDKKLEHRK